MPLVICFQHPQPRLYVEFASAMHHQQPPLSFFSLHPLLEIAAGGWRFANHTPYPVHLERAKKKKDTIQIFFFLASVIVTWYKMSRCPLGRETDQAFASFHPCPAHIESNSLRWHFLPAVATVCSLSTSWISSHYLKDHFKTTPLFAPSSPGPPFQR